MDIRQCCRNGPNVASLTSFSAAITELQHKLAHDINVIVLSYSLCSLMPGLKNRQNRLCQQQKTSNANNETISMEPIMAPVFSLCSEDGGWWVVPEFCSPPFDLFDRGVVCWASVWVA